jgi:hypothetical protein
MFPLDFTRPSELESFLSAGIGFHLRHNAVVVFPHGTFQTGCKDRNFGENKKGIGVIREIGAELNAPNYPNSQ